MQIDRFPFVGVIEVEGKPVSRIFQGQKEWFETLQDGLNRGFSFDQSGIASGLVDVRYLTMELYH